MRFAPEGDHGANSGLKAARDFLEPVKRNVPIFPRSGTPPLTNFREIPLDLLLRLMDPRRCLRYSRNARSHHPMAPWPRRP